MKQSKTVNSVLKSLQSELDLQPGEWEYIAHHVHMVYAVGYNEGTKQKSHRKMVEMFLDGKHIKTFVSVTFAAEFLGVDKSTISKRIKNGRGTYKGYTFKFLKTDVN